MLYIISGKNKFFISKKIEEILFDYSNQETQIKNFVNPNFIDFYYNAVCPDIFSKLKVLIITEIEDRFLDSISKDRGKICLDLLNSSNIIILIFNKLNKKFLVNLKNNKINLDIFNIDTKYIIKTLEDILMKNNIHISQYKLNKILERYQDNMYLLEQKLEILLCNKDDSFDRNSDVITELLDDEALPPNLFLLIDYINNCDNRKIERFLKLYFLHKQNGLALINFLITNFRAIFKVKLLLDKKFSNNKICELLNLHPYRVKKIKESKFICTNTTKFLNCLIQSHIEIKNSGNAERVIKKVLFNLIES